MDDLITETQLSHATTSESCEIDEATRRIGLKPVRAYVLEGPEKQRSSSAARTKKHRDKNAERGLMQLSVTLPIEAHEQVKTLCKRARVSGSLIEVMKEMLADLGEEASLTTARSTTDAAILETFESLSGWRRWVIAKLAKL